MPRLPDDTLLRPGPITQVRFDVTSRCNLRCVYCAVSHPRYHGMDMSDAIAGKVVDLIVALARDNRLDPIDLNGHGETTFREGWTRLCFSLVERGIPVRMTSNFAKPFDEQELEALACMQGIAVSIDAADRKLLQSLRRRVDVRQIVSNMMAVRATALRLRRKPPEFVFLCGLYDRSAVHWDELACLAIALGVSQVCVWSLTEHPGLDVPDAERVRPLDDLPDDELRPRLRTVLRGLDLLRRHGVIATVHGDFVTNLARRVQLDV